MNKYIKFLNLGLLAIILSIGNGCVTSPSKGTVEVKAGVYTRTPTLSEVLAQGNTANNIPIYIYMGNNTNTTTSAITTNSVTVWNETATGTNINVTKSMIFDNSASTNTFINIPYLGAYISWGKLYSPITNTFNKTLTLTLYSQNDYKGSNAYWRANMTLVTVGITNPIAAGTNIVQVADNTGFTTNDLVYFCDSNEFARVASIGANNSITFENFVINPHGSNSAISRVVEFGGFATIDIMSTSNIYYNINASNAFTETLNLDLSVRR